MVCQHTLEPVHFIGHIAVCPLKNIEPVVDALRTLLSHHAKTNSTLPDEQHHMVFEYVEFARDRCFRESSTIVPNELVDVAKYMYERYVHGIEVHVHVTALGVLCCFALFVCLTLLASSFLPSHLSFKNMYVYMYVYHRYLHRAERVLR